MNGHIQHRVGFLHPVILFILATLICFLIGGSSASAKDKKAGSLAKREAAYVEYVWPAPPDDPRIRLVDVIDGRLDVEADSKFKRRLLGSGPENPYDNLRKPFAVAYDGQGRLLVTDSQAGALLRFDREGGRMDVLGTKGIMRLKFPMGLDVASDGTIFVADATLAKIIAFDPEGKTVAVYGRQGDMMNPTDVLVSQDGTRLYVTDSKAHKIFIFNRETAEIESSFGGPGNGEGQFAFPTSMAWSIDGELLVVDQINARVVIMSPEGEYLDSLGSVGVGFGNFSRPKDVAVDHNGYIYVTDNAFNNVQIFDTDLTLLTFVGEGGRGPGQFLGASGIAIHDGAFAVVDQIGHRLQLFRHMDQGDS